MIPGSVLGILLFRMSLFLTVVLSIWAALNAYVFWRLGSVAWVGAHVQGWIVAAVAATCWASLPIALWVRRHGAEALGEAAEFFATTWLGFLFLLFVCLLAVDLATCGGLWFHGWTDPLRVAAVSLAAVLGVVAMIQGSREPVIGRREVVLPGLPRSADGVRLVLVSDTHLGSRLGAKWMSRLVARVVALKPDLICIAGDLADRDADRVRPLVPVLRGLRARLGVWAVLGNHDTYAGADDVAGIMRDAGFHVLRDASAEVLPGLRLVGVDDLGVRGGREGAARTALLAALSGARTEGGACILLSHTPVLLDEAAAGGAGLMLCGHTHGGQIWPFNLLVATRYRTISGVVRIGGMTTLVSRGAGTWGPRMRLWRRGEVVEVVLRSPDAVTSVRSAP